MKAVVCGLCGPARHDIPNVDNFLFPTIVENPMDFPNHYQTSMSFIDTITDNTHVHLYITGLTPVLTCFLSAWVQRNDERRRAGSPTIPLTLYHFNRDTKEYMSCLF
tara:strand:- start:6555 stop:6875 length:321 start_codon:yes stop_codon:yes gene_type:complete